MSEKVHIEKTIHEKELKYHACARLLDKEKTHFWEEFETQEEAFKFINAISEYYDDFLSGMIFKASEYMEYERMIP